MEGLEIRKISSIVLTIECSGDENVRGNSRAKREMRGSAVHLKVHVVKPTFSLLVRSNCSVFKKD